MNLPKVASIPGKGGGWHRVRRENMGCDNQRKNKSGSCMCTVGPSRTRHALTDPFHLPMLPYSSYLHEPLCRPLHQDQCPTMSKLNTSASTLHPQLPGHTWDAQSEDNWWSQSHLPQFSIATSRAMLSNNSWSTGLLCLAGVQTEP